jgi:two-component system, cell cycle sensor histidine kinase and response regulator CckA
MVTTLIDQISEDIVETIHEPLLVLDSDLKIILANRNFIDSFKVTREETLGNFIYDLGNKQWDIPRLRELLEKILPENNPFDDYEVEHDFATIGRRIMLLNARQIERGMGKERIILLAIEDITERVQSEIMLRDSEEQYRRIFETADDGILLLEKSKLKIRHANPAIMAMLGYSNEELIGNDMKDIGFPDDIGAFQKIMQALKKDGIVNYTDVEVNNKAGQVIDVDIYMVDRAKLVQCNIRDISDRKRAEEALKESEQRFRTVAKYNYHWESWVGPDGKYIYVSPSCERITGYLAEEFMKDPELFTRIVHPDDRETVSMHMKSYVDTEGTEGNHIDFRIITRGDAIRWISHYCQLVYDEEGNRLGVRASNRDFTERAKLREQLTQSQKMEGIGRLAGGVAHDFNNLLTTIIGYTEIMLTQVDQEGPLRSGMEEIKKASDRAADLTRQLLAFSRKQMMHPVVLNLNYPLAEMDKMLRRLIGEDIDLITVLEPELWKVKFDPGQMDQVVMNLAVNAKDAMPEGGKLTIETANVFLDEAYVRRHGIELKPGPFVVLAVSDTGFGMDGETQSHVFEPFFTTKEKGKGTGLGLSTVYGIVKQSGGFIWVYSEPGQGTTFKIYLPKSEAEEAFAEEEQIQPQHLEGSGTILLAEDDDSARKLIRSVLQDYGYRVLEAQDGEEALRLFEQHEGPIHLLLTDVVMPGMNGRELAESLQPLQPKMKVLYMSGYTDNAVVQHGVLEPGMSFIQKPFTPKDLASEVRKVLDC